MNRKKISLVLNIIIVVLELIGQFMCFKSIGVNGFIYYTQLSNLFLLIACILYLFKKKIKLRIVDLLKFGSTLSVLITFIVVLLVLSSFYSLHWLLFVDANLYLHFLCPVLGVITFLFFDDIKISGIKDVFGAFIFTLLYSVVFIALNILRVVEGPYPFLLVYENPIYMSLFWIVIIEGGALFLGFLLEKIKCKLWRKIYVNQEKNRQLVV